VRGCCLFASILICVVKCAVFVFFSVSGPGPGDGADAHETMSTLLHSIYPVRSHMSTSICSSCHQIHPKSSLVLEVFRCIDSAPDVEMSAWVCQQAAQSHQLKVKAECLAQYHRILQATH
jgi:hypothetical protein